MPLIERYLFRQLLGPTLLAIAVLTALALLAESFNALGLVIRQRQSLLTVAQIAFLTMPQIMATLLPVAVLVAGLRTLNRLHTEHEIIICFASGVSRWRVIAPTMRLAAWVALASLALGLWAQPLALRTLRQVADGAKPDFAVAMITPGVFGHPAPGLTVYAEAVGPDGVVRNLFVDRRDRQGAEVTVTAREARFDMNPDRPSLVLIGGAHQEISPAGVLNIVSFDRYVYDLRALLGAAKSVRYRPSDLYPHELFFPDPREAWQAEHRGELAAEGHARLAAPLYCLAFMAIALGAVVGGAYSRFGYGLRIAVAAGVSLLSRCLSLAVQPAAADQPVLNLFQYLIPVAIMAAAAAVLFRPHPRGSGRGARLAPAPLIGASA